MVNGLRSGIVTRNGIEQAVAEMDDSQVGIVI